MPKKKKGKTGQTGMLKSAYPEALFSPPPLETRKREQLVKVCEELHLPESATIEIEGVAQDLQVFERDGKPNLKSKKHRSDSLLDIARRADELFQLVAELPTHDLVELIHLQRSPPEVVGPPTYFEFTAHYSVAHHVIKNPQHLAAAASILADRLSAPKVAVGRTEVRGNYRFFIAEIWACVDAVDGFTAARDGRFNRLCNAVFEAAGVPAKADGAVRNFAETKTAHDDTIHQTFKQLGE